MGDAALQAKIAQCLQSLIEKWRLIRLSATDEFIIIGTVLDSTHSFRRRWHVDWQREVLGQDAQRWLGVLYIRLPGANTRRLYYQAYKMAFYIAAHAHGIEWLSTALWVFSDGINLLLHFHHARLLLVCFDILPQGGRQITSIDIKYVWQYCRQLFWPQFRKLVADYLQ